MQIGSKIEVKYIIISHDLTKIRNFKETFLVNLGRIIKKLSRNPKAYFLIKNMCNQYRA